MNRIYRLVWNKKRNALAAVAESVSAQGKDAGGETTAGGAKKQGREKSESCGLTDLSMMGASLLGAAILTVFPLTSFAQISPVSHVISNGETLTLSDSDSSNLDAESYLLTDDGTLDISATNNGSRIQSLSGSGGVLLGAQTLTLTNANDLFAGSISGSGGLALTNGIEILNGANDYTGLTTIADGSTLALSSSGGIASSSGVISDGMFDISSNSGASVQSLSGSGGVILGGQTLTLTNASDIFAGSINGSGGLAIAAGTEVLGGINHYTGATAINDGAALVLSGSGGIAMSSGVADNGMFNIAATANGAAIKSLSGSGSVLLGGQTLTLTNADDVFAGNIFGSGGLAVAGGVETLSGLNGYTGATTISEGAGLVLSGSGDISSSSGVADNGILNIAATANGASVKSLSGSGGVLLGGQTLTLTNADDIFAGSINGSGGLAIVAGTEVLGGINSYTGATAISDGATLALSGSGGIAMSSGVADNGIFNIAATANGASIKSLSGSGGVLLGGQTLTLTNAGDIFAGSINGSGGLAVTGGVETLSGFNSYTGATSVSNGATLKVSSDVNLGASTAQLNLNNGTLQTTDSFTTGRNITLTNSGNFNIGTNTTLDGAGSVSGSGTLVKSGEGILVLGGAVSNTGGVHVNQGTLALTGNNTYTGGTAINGGTLKVAADNNLGASGSNLTLNGGKLQTTASFTSSRSVDITGQNGAIETTGTSTTLTLDGNLSGSGRLTKDGTGTLVLAGDNAGGMGAQNTSSSGWTGGLTINSGLVTVTNPYGLGWGNVALNGGTINTTVDILTGSAIGLGSEATVNTDANTTTTLSGDIVSTNSGSGGCFTKTGLGTLNVAGNAQMDATCVLQGKLLANGNLQSVVTVEQGATLGGSGVINGPVTVRGVLSPGNSPGMLTANSTVTMATGSTFAEDIAGTQQASAATPVGATGYYSFLHVTGNNQFVIQPGATLAPALKDIFSVGETGYGSTPFVPSIGESYRIISADGGIAGRFATLTQPDGMAADTRLAVFYDVAGSNSIDLKVLPSSYSAWSRNSNANGRSAAAVLDQVADLNQSGNGSAAQDALLFTAASQSAATLPGFVKGLAGEIHGALAAVTPQAGWAMQRTVDRHLGDSQGAVGGDRNADRALWIDVTGNHGKWSDDSIASQFSANRTQITLGADLLNAPGAQLGFGYSHANADVSADLGSGSVAQNKGFVYGRYEWRGLIVDGLASYGVDKADSNRSDPTGTVASLASHADGSSSLVGIGVRAPLEFNGARYESFARATVQRVARDAASEGTASSAALGLNGFSATGSRLEAGFSGASSKTDPLATPYTYRFSLGAGADGGSLSRITQQASLAGVATGIAAPHVGRVFLEGGITGTAQLNRQSYLYISLTGEARSGYSDVGGNIGVHVNF